MSERSAPAAWVVRHLDALRDAARLGPVVDLACGRGRNALALAEAGIPVVGLDRNAGFLEELRAAAAGGQAAVDAVRCDLEGPHPMPLRDGVCGAVLVFRFLFRPLAPAIARCLAPGGLLLYETFTREQTAHGWGPSRPEFLLEPGELPRLFPDLEILEHDETPARVPRPESAARLLARCR